MRRLMIVFAIALAAGESYAQWVTTSGYMYVYSLAISGMNLFAGNSGSYVYLSTDTGTSWTQVNTGLTNNIVHSLVLSGTDLFAGTAGGGVFRSTNNGTIWTAVNTGLPPYLYVWALAVSGTSLFAGADGGVFLSTNNGATWTERNNGLTALNVRALAVSGANLFAGTYDGVFLSTNNGTSWTPANAGLTNTNVRSLGVMGTNLFAGNGTNNGGVFLSTNNGTSWTAASLGLPLNTIARAFAVSDTNLFVGTTSGVYLLASNGWIEVNTGLAVRNVWALAVSPAGGGSGTNLFAGTGTSTAGGVWRRPLSEMITSVEQVSSNLPTHYHLAQNYPNPFNPATEIRFDLPGPGTVSLVVYDVLGRKIAELAAGSYPAGYHSAIWNATDQASGVYFARFTATSAEGKPVYTQINKLILMK